METFGQTLEKYGANLDAIRSFDADSPDLLPYATLLAARKAAGSGLASLTGVYEWQNTPLVFLVEGDRLEDGQALNRIRRLLAMRGDAPYLGVVRPGQLTIYRVSLDQDPADKARINLPIAFGQERDLPAARQRAARSSPALPTLDIDGRTQAVERFHRQSQDGVQTR